MIQTVKRRLSGKKKQSVDILKHKKGTVLPWQFLFLRVKQTRFAGRRLKVVVPYGCKATYRKAISNHPCLLLRGRWLGEQLRTETEGDNKLLLHFDLLFYPLSTKSRLRSILPLSPKEKAYYCYYNIHLQPISTSLVALRHFPRFIGDICPFLGRACPKGESK